MRQKKKISAAEAQFIAHAIAFAPVVFQVARLMIKFGILQLLDDNSKEGYKGLTVKEISEKQGISEYGVKVLLESSLTANIVEFNDGHYKISKIGWFLLNDPMVQSDINFNHDVNYLGLFHLEEAIRNGKPAGLKVFGDWPTIYEGLSSLPKDVQDSWFGFDHFYSDQSFDQALPTVFAGKPGKILDIGGNTGRFAKSCVEYDGKVNVTIMDLPQQIGMMQERLKSHPGFGRISGHPGNLLDPSTAIPEGYDVIWMSQFLDCFSEEQVVSILSRVAKALKPGTRVFIMETLWDRQAFDTAAFDLAQTSVYFTAMANGNSKMFSWRDFSEMIKSAGLTVVDIKDGLGYGHSLIECR